MPEKLQEKSKREAKANISMVAITKAACKRAKTRVANMLTRRRLKAMIHVLFVFGVVVTVIGWFFDRAKSFDLLMSSAAPDYVSGTKALRDLKKDARINLTSRHEGFQVLLDKWPNLTDRDAVEFIGRSAAFLGFGSQVSSDIELIARDKRRNKVGSRWRMSAAEARIESIAEKSLFATGTMIFWVGLSISVVSHIVNAVTDS